MDLVLSLDVPVYNVNIEDAYFSDHNQIVFNITVSNSSLNCKPLGRYACSIKPSTASDFSKAYAWSPVRCKSGSLFSGRGLNVLESMFKSICNEILDTCAPFKIFGATSNPQPWLNNNTRDLQQVWKKNALWICFRTGLVFSRGSLSCRRNVGNLLWNYYRGCVGKTQTWQIWMELKSQSTSVKHKFL